MHRRFRFDRIIRSKRVMRWALVFLFVAISGVTLAYASLSTTLRITGSAEFKDASWNIVVEEAEVPNAEQAVAAGFKIDGNTALLGEAKILTKPTITGTTISGFKIEIAKLGDQAVMFYHITNKGEIPAQIESITGSDNISVTSSTNNQEDIQLVMQNFMFMPMLYSTNDTESNTQISEGSILCPGATYKIVIVNTYKPNAPRVPYSKVTISDMTVNYNFVAADQNLCNGSTPVESVG